MKKGKNKKKEKRFDMDQHLQKLKEKSLKVLDKYNEWMKPGVWVVTPGEKRASIKSIVFQLAESDLPLYINQGGSLYYNIYTNGGRLLLYNGVDLAKPDKTVRKKFTEWLKS